MNFDSAFLCFQIILNKAEEIRKWHILQGKFQFQLTLPGACFSNDFCPQFKYNGNCALLSFCCWPSDRHNFLHISWQNSYCVMYKNFFVITILQSRWEWNEISIKFEMRWKKHVWNGALGPVSLKFFARNSYSMETSPCCNSVAGHQIATIFCTCHDSTAVVPCTKFCSDHCIKL